jgi:two-component system, OmpR family, KDP operon response regulator KdpE
MNTGRILLIEDDPGIRKFLSVALEAQGFTLDEEASGKSGIAKAATAQPDLVVLDLGLPDMDGKDVVTSLRGWTTIPIIILSARERESEKIAALDLGADDYIEKPFGIGELTARIRTALRHRERADAVPAVLTNDGLVIDTVRRLVTRGEETVRLTPKEYDLLTLLARHAGRVVTHKTLLTSVWGVAHGEDLHYLRVFIGQLRQKIERDPARPAIVRTEPGVGYRLVIDQE